MRLPSDSPAAFITCTFAMLGKIAAADGKVSAEEVRKVERYIDEDLKLDAKLRVLALQVFNEAFASPLELRDYADKFSSVFKNRVQLQDQVVEVLLCLSMADGRLTAEEDRLVRSAALLLGLTVPGYERIKQKVGVLAC